MRTGSHRHSVVWLDHFEAVVMHVHPDVAETVRFSSEREPEDRQVHRKSGVPGSGHAADDVAFFSRIAGALTESEVIVVSGPGLAKRSFVSYLRRRYADLAQRVVAVETLDHPSEGELERYAKTYFKRLQALGTL